MQIYNFSPYNPNVCCFSTLHILKNMPILLFSNNCYYQLSGTAEIAELAEVDALPCAEVQTAIGDGDGDADTAQC